MKKGNFFALGMVVVLLAFGLVFAGCDSGTNDDQNNSGNEATGEENSGTNDDENTSGNGSGPKDVVLQFGKALQKKDLAAAQSYCTAESAFVLEIGLMFGEDFSEWGDEIVNATLEEEITGETAVVYDKNDPSDSRVNLVKRDGQWKIDLSDIMEND
jgi:hypothetical protein